MEAGDRGVPGCPEDRPGFRPRLLGRDSLLQPSARPRAGREDAAGGTGEIGTDAGGPPRESAYRAREGLPWGGGRALGGRAAERRLARSPRGLYGRDGAAPSGVSRRRRGDDVLRRLAPERRPSARGQDIPAGSKGRGSRAAWLSAPSKPSKGGPPH